MSQVRSSIKCLTYEGTNSAEELLALQFIVARENAIDELLQLCSSPYSCVDIDILENLLLIRQLSLDTVSAIATWRQRMVCIKPFLWCNENYLLRMRWDLDFLSKSSAILRAMDGYRLARKNPFLTIGGLEQNLCVSLWEYELPAEQDVCYLLSYKLGDFHPSLGQYNLSETQADSSDRLRLSEWYIILEERRYDKNPKNFTSNDMRMKQLVLTEAEASKSCKEVRQSLGLDKK